MEQKSTIVKCKAHPDCLLNHNGICNSYVINIDADGKCETYIETESVYIVPPSAQEIIEYTIKLEQEKLNKNIIKIPPMSKEDREIMNDIGYVPPTYPNYDECWICVHGGKSNMYCDLSVIPMIGPDGKCCRFSRRVE